MTVIHFVRHAPVVGKAKIIYGADADIDLRTVKPRLDELALLLPKPATADWYYSGVERTKRTALAILEHQRETFMPLIEKGFREQDFGNLLDKSHDDVKDHLKFIDGKIYTPNPPGGESIANFISRVGAAIINIHNKAVSNGKREIVVISHGGTIRAAHAYLNKLLESQFIDLDTPPLCLHNYDL